MPTSQSALAEELADRLMTEADPELRDYVPPDNDNDAEPYDYKEDFWLARPDYSEEFAADVVERFTTHIEQWENGAVGSAVWDAYRAYHNLAGVSGDPLTQITATGEVGELLALAIPHYRSLVRHQIALFTSQRPAWEPQARTSDATAARQVPMAGNLLDYVVSQGGLDQRLAEQCEMMMVAGAGYFVTGWDPDVGITKPPGGAKGWFTQRVYAPWELCHERVRVYEDATWWIFRTFESRWNWVARLAEVDPEKAEKLARLDTDASDFAKAFRDGDEELLHDTHDRFAALHVIAKPTRAVPAGRYAIIASDDLVLFDAAYPYGDEVTISRMCASEFLGTSTPYCDSWGVLAAADASNAILSMILTRIDTCGIPNFCVPEGTEIEFADIAGGNQAWKLPPGGEKPSVVDLLQIPDALPAIMQLINGSMEGVVGINSVTRGQPQENVTSGSMAALLQGMAIQFNSNLERAWTLNLERVGTHHLRVFRVMASQAHAVSVMGSDNRWTVQEFKGEDLANVSRVAVRSANALSKTTAGRADIAEKLLQHGGGITPQEYLRVIQTGQLEPLFHGPAGQLTGIKARCEKLLRGQPSPPLTWDNHQLCIREFRALLDSEAREDPKAVELINQTLQEQFSLWGQLSRESPDILIATGCPPLPQAAMIGQQAQMMEQSATMPDAPPAAPADPGAAPQQQKQPETDAPRGRPGPNPAPKGQEPSRANPKQPTEPKPARNPMNGEPVV
jgi:hypothetical protein